MKITPKHAGWLGLSIIVLAVIVAFGYRHGFGPLLTGLGVLGSSVGVIFYLVGLTIEDDWLWFLRRRR